MIQPQLPSRWETTCLADAGEIVSGVTLGRNLNGSLTRRVPYLRVANVKDGRLDLPDIYETDATDTEIKKLKLAQGDLVLTEGGDADKLGRATFWNDELPECIHQNHIFRVRLNRSRFDPAFVAALLASPYGRAYFARHAKQTTGIATINRRVLSAFPLCAPTLPIQIRIAARLREQLAEVERARAAVAAQLQGAETLIEALLRDSLRSAAQYQLHECLREVTEGIGQNWKAFPLLGATRAGLAPAKDPVGKSPERYKPVRVGTIFYNPMRILLGSVAMVDEGDEPGITSPDYVVMRGVENKVHPRWFYYWFRSSNGAEFIKSVSRGAVRERLLFRRLAKASVPVPAWGAQEVFAKQVREIRQMKASLTERLNLLEKIPSALLHEAFSGRF